MKSTSEGPIKEVVQEKKDDRSIRSKIFRRARAHGGFINRDA